MKRPLSMTAFGRGEHFLDDRTWVAEIRSVNHRFLDLKIKVPPQYAPLEENIRKEVASFYSRGHVNITITLANGGGGNIRLKPNLTLARDIYDSLIAIRRELDLKSSPDLDMLASFRDIITPVEVEENLEKIWSAVRQALRSALQNGQQMREKEGDAIKKDLLSRLDFFARTVREIEQNVPALLKYKETSLGERLDKLLKSVDLDPQRLSQEVAILTDRLDVTEEIVRLRSHIEQFRIFLDHDEPAGRRLDFLLQEFLREINTMASKISDAPTAHKAVELKNELEKMREQVQNLE